MTVRKWYVSEIRSLLFKLKIEGIYYLLSSYSSEINFR